MPIVRVTPSEAPVPPVYEVGWAVGGLDRSQIVAGEEEKEEWLISVSNEGECVCVWGGGML